MENHYISTYLRPEACMIVIDPDDLLCISGNHEGIEEEDWYALIWV